MMKLFSLSISIKVIITTIQFLISSNHVFGQVENDNIENRKIIYQDRHLIISNNVLISRDFYLFHTFRLEITF